MDSSLLAFLTVFSNPHTEWDIEDIPLHLRSYRDQVRLAFFCPLRALPLTPPASQIYSDDLRDHHVPEAGKNAPLHAKYGVDVNKGAIVLVRPDGYVGAIVSLDADGFEALNAYFAGFLI